MLLQIFCLLLIFSAGCDRSKPGGPYTVGAVSLNPEHDKILLGFKKGLADSGYVEGKNITFIYNGARENLADIEDDIQALISRKVDLILALSTPAAQKTKLLTAGRGIPVLFAPVYDPVGAGLVENLVHPGANLTGIKVGGNCPKALEWCMRISPHIKNIFVPFNSSNEATVISLHDLQQAADRIGVQLTVREAHDEKELEDLLQNLPAGSDALWLLNSHFLVRNTDMYVAAAIKFKLPLGSNTSQADGGVMVAYGQNPSRTGELAAGLAAKILQGSSPADLPVENTDFFLGINLKTAESIGIDISDDILHVADTIIRP